MACVVLERRERKVSRHSRGRGDAVGIAEGSSSEEEVEGQKRSSLSSSDMHCRPCSSEWSGWMDVTERVLLLKTDSHATGLSGSRKTL